MKKPVLLIILGMVFELLALGLFIFGMSSPTVTGPAFMHTVWLGIIIAGAILILAGIAHAIVKK